MERQEIHDYDGGILEYENKERDGYYQGKDKEEFHNALLYYWHGLKSMGLFVNENIKAKLKKDFCLNEIILRGI